MSRSRDVIRIGGGSAYFADSALGVPQLLAAGRLDYLVFDYLAEASMGMLGQARQADPAATYPADFLAVHVGPHLRDISRQGIKIVANAGALDPRALARAVELRIAEEGLSLRVAAITGDDLMGRVHEFRARGIRDMFTDAPFPSDVLTCNAYLGGFPIAAALAGGADIVITGRIVDSAIVLGPLIHEFGWRDYEFDLLAAGTLAGHLLECSTQITGGTFTDWHAVGGWETIGFPIGECHADGSIVITKPDGSGGLVSVGTVAEQLLYEISDPADYVVADVSCDFSNVRLGVVGPNRVHVRGARGRPPTPTLKVSVTYGAGWRAVAYQPIVGEEAGAKARRQGEAILSRARAVLRAGDLGDFTGASTTIIGDEASFGPHARFGGGREVILKMTVDHPSPQGAGLFAREQASGITTMSVGTGMNIATSVLPLTEVFGFLVPREEVAAVVLSNGQELTVPSTPGQTTRPARGVPPSVPPGAGALVPVDLIRLAWGRSGDKGSLFNVAVIARDPDFLPWIAASMTTAAVGQWYAHLRDDGTAPPVKRYYVPGFAALNFVVRDSLGGGILSGTGLDPAAKSMAQLIMRFPILIPATLSERAEQDRTEMPA